MPEKKKICFYSILSSGHLNVCASVGSLILNKYSDTVEVWFIVDKQWHQKMSEIDSRFKYGIIEHENPEAENALPAIIKALESCLTMNPIEKISFLWELFLGDKNLMKRDALSEKEILKIKPDFCMHIFLMKSPLARGLFNRKVANPSCFDFDQFPKMGTSYRIDDKEGIEKFARDFEQIMSAMRKRLSDYLAERNCKYENKNIPFHKPLSDHFSLYAYPQEVDYFDEEFKKKHKLWQIDSPLFKQRIPKPYELPEEFAKLPAKKIVYVSLGSLFSAYTNLLQRLVDILEKLPFKYIVSKGPNGDKLKFPSNKFIGDNFVNQLAVLQVVDGMIAHGGNNTFGECFYFGVPQIILPVLGNILSHICFILLTMFITADQINNAARLEETGYGYQLDLLNYTEEQLSDRLSKILNDEELRTKLKKASERIRKEERFEKVVDRIVDYIRKL